MKKFSHILHYVSSSLVVLVALVFTVLESTLLITLDFTLYENQLVALIQLILRLLIASSALTLGIMALIKKTQSFLPYSICLVSISVVMIPFVSNNFGIYFTIISALFTLSQLLLLKFKS